MQPDTPVRSLLVLAAAGSFLVAGAALPAAHSPVAEAVARTDFDASAVTYGGEVAVEDLTVQFRGRATGVDEVVFVLVGSSGAVVAERGATDAAGGFDRDVTLEGSDRPLNPGQVQALVVTPGSDGVFGSEDEAPETASDLVDFANELGAERLSQSQVVRRLRQATVDVMGSDDLASASEFALAQADTEITNLSTPDPGTAGARQFVPGDVVVVQGQTNRRPDQNAIDVSVAEGPSAGEFEAPIVNEWGTDGVWTARIPVPPDARPGNYTVRASDGDSSDTVRIAVVGQQAGTAEPAANASDGAGNASDGAATGSDGAANETAQADGTPMPVGAAVANETATVEATTTEPAPAETATEPAPTETATTATTTTTPGQPGFGLLVGLVSVAVALVVRRRLVGR